MGNNKFGEGSEVYVYMANNYDLAYVSFKDGEVESQDVLRSFDSGKLMNERIAYDICNLLQKIQKSGAKIIFRSPLEELAELRAKNNS